MTICLSANELAELTGKVRPSAQARVLNALGIDHKRRPDGSVLVLREALACAKLPAPKKTFEVRYETLP